MPKPFHPAEAAKRFRIVKRDVCSESRSEVTMGTWGYEPLDNDAALDVQHIWESYVEDRINDGEWTTKDIVNYLAEHRWGDAINCGDNITNSEIIALVEILRARNLEVPKELKRIA